LAETQTRSLPTSFGEEGLKRPFQRRSIHPDAGVRDGDHDILAGLDGLGEPVDVAFVEVAVRGLERHLAAIRHGVAGVRSQIDNGISS
jgi:hypothetical protein